ncbi:MAG: hypothetical protein HPY61_13235 [Methanotrichaceae archaeon]|nr:hypothetical protein [Methanotrichaceae archaeon]
MAESKEVHHVHDQPIKVILQTTKSGYKWEITVQGSTTAAIMPVLRETNEKLKREYGKGGA